MMQPSFMPWMGFFSLIDNSDIFIFLDDFQYSVQSFHQRNRLFIDKGKIGWYTVPIIKGISFKAALNKAKINDHVPWRQKLWSRFEANYQKCLYYKKFSPMINKWLFAKTHSLAEHNIIFIKLICDLLNFKPKFRFSSKCQKKSSQRSQKIIDLLKWCKVTKYLAARGSFAYLKKDGIFPVSDLEIVFQDFTTLPYPQRQSPNQFFPNLSIIDALMNVGISNTKKLIKQGTSQWLTWEQFSQIAIKGTNNHVKTN